MWWGGETLSRDKIINEIRFRDDQAVGSIKDFKDFKYIYIMTEEVVKKMGNMHEQIQDTVI